MALGLANAMNHFKGLASTLSKLWQFTVQPFKIWNCVLVVSAKALQANISTYINTFAATQGGRVYNQHLLYAEN